MKSLLLGIAMIGLLVGWGLFGAQQAKQVGYDCKVRVEKLCYYWEKNAIGKTEDKLHKMIDKALK